MQTLLSPLLEQQIKRQQAVQKWMHFGFGMEVNLQIYCESSPWLGVVQLPESAGVWIT